MNIFNAILEAIQACEADIIDSRQCATGEQRSNCKEVAIAERLVEKLRDNIIEQRNLNQSFMLQGTRLMPPDFANKCEVVDATLLSILNMEI